MFDVEPTPLPPPPVELTRYAVAGRYVLEGPLGEGGMGRVHRVRHRHLGRGFALKVIAPSFRDAHDARARFTQEARLASEMRHPNIVEVVDFGDDPALGAFMVMELVEGAPLIDPAAAPPSLARVCEYLRQIADALDHIHRHGVLHGDLKPDNILVASEAEHGRKRAMVKLLDFGLARRIDHAGDEPLAGSPSYIAPERITGGPASVAADVYALGILAYELITGAPPFVGELADVLRRHVHEPPAPLVTSAGGEPVDEALAALVARAIAKAPDQRHRSIGAAASRTAAQSATSSGNASPSAVSHAATPTSAAGSRPSILANAALTTTSAPSPSSSACGSDTRSKPWASSRSRPPRSVVRRWRRPSIAITFCSS